MKEYLVSKFEEGQTLEKFIKRHLESAPLSFIYKLFRKKDIKVNDKRSNDRKYVVKENDNIKVYITDSQIEEFEKRFDHVSYDSLKDKIVYEDENIIIINKPKGLLVIRNNANGISLDNIVKSYFCATNNVKEGDFVASPCHRIDRNTSGLIIFGKNVKTMQILMNAFKDRDGIHKSYLALVNGATLKEGRIDTPLYKNADTGMVYPLSISEGGKTAITLYKVKESFKDYTLLDIDLLTGRTHQIRAHMLSINHPLVGDPKYGDFKVNKTFEKKYRISSQFLHAYKITFGKLEEPLSYLEGKTFVASLPKDEEELLENLRKN